MVKKPIELVRITNHSLGWFFFWKMGKEQLHWSSLTSRRLSRRQLLRAGAVGGLGLAMGLVLGCDEEKPPDSQQPVVAKSPESSNNRGSGEAQVVELRGLPDAIDYMLQLVSSVSDPKVIERVRKIKDYYQRGIFQVADKTYTIIREEKVAIGAIGDPNKEPPNFGIFISPKTLADPTISKADLALFLYQVSIVYEEAVAHQGKFYPGELEDIKTTAWLQTRDEALPIFGPGAKNPIFKGAYAQCLDAGKCQK